MVAQFGAAAVCEKDFAQAKNVLRIRWILGGSTFRRTADMLLHLCGSGPLVVLSLLFLMSLFVTGKENKPFYPPGCAVKELDSDAFERIMYQKRNKKYLIVYYAPWCGKTHIISLTV